MNLDGYPEEEELDKIRTWTGKPHELFDFIRSIWWANEWGFHQDGNKYSLSTGGWSGNESIIAAMRENQIFWLMYWESSRRGGHYTFEVR